MKGLSLGAVLAIVISFAINKSIPWAIFHGLLGWFYIFYYIAVYIMHIGSPLHFNSILKLFH